MTIGMRSPGRRSNAASTSRTIWLEPGPVVRLEDVHPQEQRRAGALLARVEPGARAGGERGAARLDLEVGEPALEPGVELLAPEALAAHEAGGVVAAGAQA